MMPQCWSSILGLEHAGCIRHAEGRLGQTDLHWDGEKGDKQEVLCVGYQAVPIHIKHLEELAVLQPASSFLTGLLDGN